MRSPFRAVSAAAVVGPLLLLVLLLLCVSVEVKAEEAKKLYPACGGSELRATARAQQEASLYTFYYSYDGIAVDCLAYEVTSVRGGQKDQSVDHCLIEHQTEYAYAIMLRASYTDDDGNTVTRDFSLRDMTGGSLTEVIARMPQTSRYAIMFKNLAENTKCTLQVRALLSLSLAPKVSTAVMVPTVVAIEPRTVYTKDSPRTYVVLDHGTGSAPSRNDVVTLVDYTLGTCERPAGDTITMDYASTIPATVHLPNDPTTYSARTATFYEPNTYRVCFRDSDADSAIEIAILTAFSGNPAYYEVTSGQDEQGHVLVGEEATIKFYGYDLDTRKHGDEAKFVWFTDECDSGMPAAGVPLDDDLGPSDNYGPNTTYALWTWTMREEGSFKVCYKRKATGKWTEVPSIEDVGPSPAPDNTTPAPVPDPTDPDTGATCPKLTYDPKNPWKKYKSVQVTLSTRDIPDDFFASLSKLLCLPQNMFTVMHSRKSASGYKNVFLTLDCDATGKENICDTTERLNYFSRLSADELEANGITEVVGSTSMFAFDDDMVVTVIKRSSGTLVFCSLCVLAGGGMAIFAVSRYQERRHHFTQFGLDEDDIDDMYDFGSAPNPNVRNHYDVSGAPAAPQEPARIQNAVIEIED